jgi:membrane-bound lytic murein transglycosylase A
MKKYFLSFLVLGLVVVFIQAKLFNPAPAALSQKSELYGIVKENVSVTGKDKTSSVLPHLYNKSFAFFSPLDNEKHLLPSSSKNLRNALAQHSKLLSYKANETYYESKNLVITKGLLDSTVQLLKVWSQSSNEDVQLADLFDTYLLKGKDRKGNSQFTGYFSPVIEVSETYSSSYPFPIYRKPDSEAKNEVAWAKSKKDVKSLQLQGSGFVKYANGSTEYLSYGGNNGRIQPVKYPARKASLVSTSADSVARKKYKNPNHTFFKSSSKSQPTGAGGVELTPLISVAVDPRIVPLGSCLIAEVPIIDEEGRLIRHELRIILAQDTGGAIKGSGRFDYYMGTGNKAHEKARFLKHYGRVWLLTPKR